MFSNTFAEFVVVHVAYKFLEEHVLLVQFPSYKANLAPFT